MGMVRTEVGKVNRTEGELGPSWGGHRHAPSSPQCWMGARCGSSCPAACTLRGAIRNVFNFLAACRAGAVPTALAGGETEAPRVSHLPRECLHQLQAAVGRQLKQQTFLSPSPRGWKSKIWAQVVRAFPGEGPVLLLMDGQPLTVSSSGGEMQGGRCTDASSYRPRTLSDQGPTS